MVCASSAFVNGLRSNWSVAAAATYCYLAMTLNCPMQPLVRTLEQSPRLYNFISYGTILDS